MKFKIHVKDSNNDWFEEYNEKTEDAQEYAEKMVESFNNTLKPYETKRTLISVEVMESSNDELHDWVKQSYGMSQVFRGQIVDIMRCSKCGITGKRFGLSSHVKIDSKYKKKCFQKCNTSKEELRKSK